MKNITSAQLKRMGISAGNAKRRHKYNVSPKEDRTWNGKVYPSKAEMLFARGLWAGLGEQYVEIIEQPRLWLGVRENVYVPDFLVIPKDRLSMGPDPAAPEYIMTTVHNPYYIDVKGMETPAFRKVKKLWKAYARLSLHIMEQTSGDRFRTREIIEGGGNR